MTEDEAKQKNCPMSFNTPVQADILPCCASMCACWVSTDNECFPTEPGHKSKSYPAGHCGLIK